MYYIFINNTNLFCASKNTDNPIFENVRASEIEPLKVVVRLNFIELYKVSQN